MQAANGQTHVFGEIRGLSQGMHGFHIHQFGDQSAGCKSMGGHFNPLMNNHGAPHDTFRHVGDLGNIVADEGGVARVDVLDSMLSLTGPNSIIGRGLVVSDARRWPHCLTPCPAL